ncbi:MAG TPA: thiamine diphosphokinase, partial [Chloroflexi bacterium]|nr:thiamine diphosphokinase [Chloroflexota bacterium]
AQGDFLIAADGGARHLLKLGRFPDLLIGDLDSLTPAEVDHMQANGTQVERYPIDKDWTDLELALEAALQRGFHHLNLAGALGSRIDHTLGNLFLLTHPKAAGVDLRLEDGREELRLVKGEITLRGQPGDRVSLVPLDEIVEGVRTRNLQWPLEDETLYRHATRGISNLMTAATATISARMGVLLCIHTRKEFFNDEESQ